MMDDQKKNRRIFEIAVRLTLGFFLDQLDEAIRRKRLNRQELRIAFDSASDRIKEIAIELRRLSEDYK